jgi:hypothetical protein
MNFHLTALFVAVYGSANAMAGHLGFSTLNLGYGTTTNLGYGHQNLGYGHHSAGYDHHTAGYGHHTAGYGHHATGYGAIPTQHVVVQKTVVTKVPYGSSHYGSHY